MLKNLLKKNLWWKVYRYKFCICLFIEKFRNSCKRSFGIRAGQSKISNACGKTDANGFADVTAAQHCRAEFL